MAVRVVFMGTPEFAVPSLRCLLANEYGVVGVFTQPDRPAGRGRRLAQSPVKELASEENVNVYQPGTLREPQTLGILKDLSPDVIVVAAYGLILPDSVLGIPPRGCLNVHASLLPKYRGAAPVPAAILGGERSSGVTIMLMDAGLDTGPILAQDPCEIGPQDTTATLTPKMAELGAALLMRTLPQWLTGEICPRPQDEAEATYAPMIRKEARLVDWSLSAEQLARQVRAYQPWPGSVTDWQGTTLKLLEVDPRPGASRCGHPGLVVRVGDEIAVVTGEGLLALRVVQLSGRRPLQGHEFVRGCRGFVGSVLGQPCEDRLCA